MTHDHSVSCVSCTPRRCSSHFPIPVRQQGKLFDSMGAQVAPKHEFDDPTKMLSGFPGPFSEGGSLKAMQQR